MEKINAANDKALEIILNGQPSLVGIEMFRCSSRNDRKTLHAGPPITWIRPVAP